MIWHVLGFIFFAIVCFFVGLGVLLLIVYSFSDKKDTSQDAAKRQFDADYGDPDE